MKKESSGFIKLIVLLVILTLFFVGLTCFYQVRITEAVILTSFEKPVKTVTDPGLKMKLPWPIQKVYPFDLRTNIYQSPNSEYLVKDGFNVVVKAFACWKIKDVGTYKNKVGVTVGDGEKKIRILLDKYLKITIGEHRLSDFIGVGTKSDNENFSNVEKTILDSVNKESQELYGVEVSSFGFERFALPAEPTKAVFARMAAERNMMIQEILKNGEREASKIRTDADEKSKKLIAEAKADAIRIKGEADAEAYKYLEVYKKNPEFALFLKNLQALENSMKKKTTIVIDKNTPPFNMFSSDILNKEKSK